MSKTRRLFGIPFVLVSIMLFTRVAWPADSSVPGDFATIQGAIDDAGTVAGDTITVDLGSHTESNIHITKSVTIQGAGIGLTSIDGSGGGIGFFVDVDDVTLRDMTIENFSQAIRFEKANGTIDDTTLERLSLFNNSSRGIEVHNATTVTDLLVQDCNFELTNIGIRVSSSGHLERVKFLDSTFLSNVIGIYEANDGGSSTMKGLEVRGCTFTDHTAGQGTAIFLEEIQDAVIEENSFIDNRRDIQIFKWYQASLPVSNVLIQDNTMTGTKDSVFAIFNREHDGGFDPGQTRFDGVTFTGNAALIDPSLADNGGAVFAGAHSGPSLGGLGWETVQISCNSFRQAHVGEGVRFFIPGVSDEEALGGASIDVRNNWWGTTDGVAILALMQVPEITDFEPFLLSPPTPPTCPLIGPPTAQNQCMEGGWMIFNSPVFSSQGDCVSFFSTGGKPRQNR